MTELEILERAKLYVSKLANGIDPITDREVSETDAVNQVRVSRCLFYVADVLQKVIDNGGTVSAAPQPKPKKADFTITPEELTGFRYYTKPVAISEIVRQLNDLAHTENIKKLTYNQVAAWLLAQGIFCKKTEPSGRVTNRPTEKGKAIGISTEKRTFQQGESIVVVLNRNAQQFLIEHLTEILSYEPEATENDERAAPAPTKAANKIPEEPARFTSWTEEEDLFLRELYERGASMGDMILSLHREPVEISARIKALHFSE